MGSSCRNYCAEIKIVCTSRPCHAAELAQAAAVGGVEVVIVVGGDGTANEVLNGLLLARQAGLGSTAMGVLAVGQGNDFMAALFELRGSSHKGRRISY